MDKVFNPEQEKNRTRADSTIPFSGRISQVESRYIENTVKLDEKTKKELLTLENPYSEIEIEKFLRQHDTLRDMDPAVAAFLAIKLQKQEEEGVPSEEMLH